MRPSPLAIVAAHSTRNRKLRYRRGLGVMLGGVWPSCAARANNSCLSDRGREDRLARSPLPPNRACGSPAHGSPVGGSPLNGLARPPSGEPHGKLPECSEEDARSSHPPSLGSPSCQHTSRTHRRFCPAVLRQASPGCLARRTGTGPGLDSHDTPVTHPPSCSPSLHRSYPASSLLWPL
jgi:hypothetical protein